ncbi:unnamed protein product [Protopolystoma xenopodis]|uniref:Uncharacterized protein n=1 Tax=Protopolystoma xenopodis TaxID=117903 RepID=A0A3S5ACJ8_9PLAT|nr:unnamed protein product [Protopolystoma xenopodis]
MSDLVQAYLFVKMNCREYLDPVQLFGLVTFRQPMARVSQTKTQTKPTSRKSLHNAVLQDSIQFAARSINWGLAHPITSSSAGEVCPPNQHSVSSEYLITNVKHHLRLVLFWPANSSGVTGEAGGLINLAEMANRLPLLISAPVHTNYLEAWPLSDLEEASIQLMKTMLINEVAEKTLASYGRVCRQIHLRSLELSLRSFFLVLG